MVALPARGAEEILRASASSITQIQAAHVAPALRRASELSRRLLPPPLSLRAVGSDPAGGGLCAKCRTRSGAPGTRAIARVRCAHVVATAVDQPGGDPAPPIGFRARLNRRQTSGGPLAAGRRTRGG